MSDLLIDLDLKTERVSEPPKRWRNWWFSHGAGDEGPWREGCDDQSNPQADPTIYPSKDAAEAVADHQVEQMGAAQGPSLLTYLGAYPEGERPK